MSAQQGLHWVRAKLRKSRACIQESLLSDHPTAVALGHLQALQAPEWTPVALPLPAVALVMRLPAVALPLPLLLQTLAVALVVLMLLTLVALPLPLLLQTPVVGLVALTPLTLVTLPLPLPLPLPLLLQTPQLRAPPRAHLRHPHLQAPSSKRNS